MQVAGKTEDHGDFVSQLHRKNDSENVLNDYELG